MIVILQAIDSSMFPMYSQTFIHITYKGTDMTRIDEINAQIAKLEEERKSAMLAERGNVLARVKDDIKLFGFKTGDFKGFLVTRKKRGAVVKKIAVKKIAK